MAKKAAKPIVMEMEMDEKDYEAECAAKDLLRAEEVKKNPELLKKAMQILGKQKEAITSLEELKAYANKKMMEKPEAEEEDEE
jgi:hypothetical protein